MAQVNIPWFTGGQALLGKGYRAQRQLQALSNASFGLGNFLRTQRSAGLPKGATDQDLLDTEASLESQLGLQQGSAVNDTTHGIERARSAGDDETADAIGDDPAGYASGKHEAKQSMLGELGSFMKSGVERLLMGDPQRAQRMSHIRRMQGELDFQKRKEAFLRNVGPIAARSEDPGKVLEAAGGARYGITSLPGQAAKKGARGRGEAEADSTTIPIPKITPSGVDANLDANQAEANLKHKLGRDLTKDDGPLVVEEIRRIQEARKRGLTDYLHDKTMDEFKQKRKIIEDAKAADRARKIAEGQQPEETTVEKTYTDPTTGKKLSPVEAEAARLQGKPVTESVVKSKRKLPPKEGEGTEGAASPAFEDPGLKAGGAAWFKQ